MKLSEMQEILEKYKNQYGDIEIKVLSMNDGKEYPVISEDFYPTSNDYDNPKEIEYISILA